MNAATGIYVEIFIQDALDHVWRLTQEPELHERWDLRFSHIHYLPRASTAEPSRTMRIAILLGGRP